MTGIYGYGLKGPQGVSDAQPSADAEKTGKFAGKSVTVGGGGLTTGQRVALGIVTLGISELVIRLAQRKPPEVVPTAGPGRAAQTLNPAHADRVPEMPPPMDPKEIELWHKDILTEAL